ncbi:MAG TPA: nitrogen regulation protein NR(I), partial [Rhodobacteraceae bacterium]|nr:nitrogen regulation protein NR(I) [Paracoccaceae bacterium]
MDGTILVADDDRTIRTVLTQALTRAGCKVRATSNISTLWRWIEDGEGDAVISDVMMPDGNGLDLLPAIQKKRPNLPVIVISAQNTVVTAIRATDAGAYEYMPKPFDLRVLLSKVSKALTQKSQTVLPAEQNNYESEFPLVGGSPAMQEVYRVVARVVNTDLSVLILGASGTGKDLLARSLHEL